VHQVGNYTSSFLTGWSRSLSDHFDFHFLPDVSVLDRVRLFVGTVMEYVKFCLEIAFLCVLSLSARLDPVYLSVCQDFVSLHSVSLFCEVLRL
jgi:hypothetical protein